METVVYLKASGTVTGPVSFNSLLDMHNGSRLPSDTKISDREEGPFLPFHKSPILNSMALTAPQWYWRTPMHSVGPITGEELRQHLATNNLQFDGEVFHSFFTGNKWIPSVDCQIYDLPNSGGEFPQPLVWGKDDLTNTSSLDTHHQGLKGQLDSKRVEQIFRDAQVAVKKDLKLGRARDNAIRVNTFAWISGFVVLAGLVVTGIYFGGRLVADKMRDTKVGKSVARQSGSQFSVASHEKAQYKKLIEDLGNMPSDTYLTDLQIASSYLKLLANIEEGKAPPTNIGGVRSSPPLNLESGLEMLSNDMHKLLKSKIPKEEDDFTYQQLRSVKLDLQIAGLNQTMLLLYTRYYLKKCGVKEADLDKVKSHNDKLNKLLDDAQEDLNKLAVSVGASTYERDDIEDILRLFNDYIGTRVGEKPTTGDGLRAHSRNCRRRAKLLLQNQLNLY